MTDSVAKMAQAQPAAAPGAPTNATVTTTREVNETEELAIRMMALLDLLNQKEEEIANLRMENGRLAAQLNATERHRLAQKYQLQGSIKLDVQGDKRVLTQTVAAPKPSAEPPKS